MGKIVPVVLCGGSGTRLWPLSRPSRPKPFLALIGENTLFEATLERASDPTKFAPPIIVAGAAHIEHIQGQLSEAADAEIIVEPAARNTAPAIALAAARLPADAVMLVCPSDHHIADTDAFVEAAGQASKLAQQGFLVAFGIDATSPETGYGYLRQGAPLGGGYRIAQFVEKPDLARAEAFLAAGDYCWNGGLFAFRAGDFLAELAEHRPAMHAAVLAATERGTSDGRLFHPDGAEFDAIQGESVDYAVMENTDQAAMVPAAMGWSDIGNWQALHEAQNTDGDGNAASGRAELMDCTNVMVRSDGPRVSAVGLENIVIVVEGDEVLVTTHAGAQLVGKLKGASGK
ncbi:sugar phosphate nucleotidyltransferase [Altererythrobacter sp. ZODW24]|uniref:mannose-1-phosphate guanylyltransferase n=1 Tax=Altererythrobacter sp. ZODW24 TaxID=2185142 RepID=UPI000DF7FB0E|nr:sugar phosphate nucleotidyltransferase [Altererythrobacter sp. ZODW24]